MRWKRHHIEIEESILTLICDAEFAAAGVETVRKTRAMIEEAINRHPEFGITHQPFDPPENASAIVRHMCAAAYETGVGPMACVAGVIAHACLEAVLKAGAKEAVVDNGGDIALFICEPVLVGIYTGSKLFDRFAFRIKPGKCIRGICTSSGMIGHSASYGKADAAIVFSNDLALADAAATALGNRIEKVEDLQNCFDFLKPLSQIQGAMAVFKGNYAIWGDLPEIVEAGVDEDLITFGAGYTDFY